MIPLAETKQSSIKYFILNAVLQARSRGASSAEVAHQLHLSTQLANYHLLRLAREGLIQRIEVKKITYHKPYVRYRISPEGKSRLDGLLLELVGGRLEKTELDEIIDLDFQNLHTLFRQFVDKVKNLVMPAQLELLNFLREAVTGEIEKLQQAMKLRLAAVKEIPYTI